MEIKSISKGNHVLQPAPSNRLRFKRTDELMAMVRSIVITHHEERGEEIDRAQLRRVSTRLLVAIEEGVRKIPLSRVRAL
jgi:hypothetical protein